MKRIKEDCTATGVSASLGGVTGASDVCELPRDEQHISQAKLQLKSSMEVPSSYGGSPSDELSVIMHRA